MRKQRERKQQAKKSKVRMIRISARRLVIFNILTILTMVLNIGMATWSFKTVIDHNKTIRAIPQLQVVEYIATYVCLEHKLGLAEGVKMTGSTITISCENGNIEMGTEGSCNTATEMPCDEVIDGRCVTDTAKSIERAKSCNV